jgi:hypothetical protein
VGETIGQVIAVKSCGRIIQQSSPLGGLPITAIWVPAGLGWAHHPAPGGQNPGRGGDFCGEMVGEDGIRKHIHGHKVCL